MLERALSEHIERQTSQQVQFRDTDVETSSRDFTREKALSPISVPKGPTLMDAASSPCTPLITSRVESGKSSVYRRRRSLSEPSVSSHFTPVSEQPKSAHSE